MCAKFMDLAVIGLIVISSLTVAAGPLTVWFLVNHLKDAQGQFISHLDSRPVILGKPETVVQTELEIEKKRLQIEEAKVAADSQLKLQHMLRRRSANQNGGTVAEVIEHGP